MIQRVSCEPRRTENFGQFPSGQRAFTLVELLVVIGIIAVLIGLLMPAFSKARAQSVQLQCASTLRSWGQAFFEYAAQNRGVYPHSGDESNNPTATMLHVGPEQPAE